MCGIIAEFNTQTQKKKKIIKAKDANLFIRNQYQEQYSRGVKGFGSIRIDKKRKVTVSRNCEPIGFLVDLHMEKAKMIIAHHRTPTSTDNTLEQTHPMFITNPDLKYDYYIVHNGIVANDLNLYDKHTDLGFYYRTEYMAGAGYHSSYQTKKFNDSEAIAIEMALFIENKIKAVRTESRAALIALQVDKKTNKAIKVFFGKNGVSAALNLDKKKGQLKLSSVGKGEAIDANSLYSFKVNDTNMKLSKKNFPFELEKEITIEKDHPVTCVCKKCMQTPTEEELKTKKTDHHKDCKCIDCVLDKKIEESKERNSKLPTITLPVSNIKIVREISDEEPATSIKKIEIPTKRTWDHEIEPNHILDETEDNFIYTKNYKENQIKTLTESMTNKASYDIASSIELQLNLQARGAFRLLECYSDSLIQNKPSKGTKGYYITQLLIIMHTMDSMTEEAERLYQDKILEEEYLDDYSCGFNYDRVPFDEFDHNKDWKNTHPKKKQPEPILH